MRNVLWSALVIACGTMLTEGSVALEETPKTAPDTHASFQRPDVAAENAPDDWPEELRLENAIYHPAISTVQLYPTGAQLSEPYLELGLGATLDLHFDDLEADYRDLYYSVIHCTHDWQHSDLDESAYLTGFHESSISSIDDSFNTRRSYTHYTATFPNEMSGLQISGNYVMVVYADSDKEQLILSRRFVIYEQAVTIATNVHQATAVEESRYKQEVDFSVHHPSYTITNPYTDFHVAVLQNNRWDNAIYDLEPRFVKGEELSYDYSRENNFDGGNEWRPVDTKSLRFKTFEIDSMGLWKDDIHCWVKPFGKRSFKQYRTQPDIEGKFLVKNDDAGDSNLEAEYIVTHFRLPFEIEFTDADIFVFGGLSQFRCQERFRMHYNYLSKSYELEVPVKQGYINYQYAVKRRASEEVDLVLIEGSHRQTHNIYSVFAYNWEPALGYHRVVGAAFTNSFNE